MTDHGLAAPRGRITVLPPASWAEGAADLLERALYLCSIEDRELVEKAIRDHLKEWLPDRVKTDRDVALSTIEGNRRLRLALETFGRHLDWCGEWAEGKQPCECGLAAILEQRVRP